MAPWTDASGFKRAADEAGTLQVLVHGSGRWAESEDYRSWGGIFWGKVLAAANVRANCLQTLLVSSGDGMADPLALPLLSWPDSGLMTFNFSSPRARALAPPLSMRWAGKKGWNVRSPSHRQLACGAQFPPSHHRRVC